MKSKLELFGFIVFAALIAFLLAACGGGDYATDSGGINPGGDAPSSGGRTKFEGSWYSGSEFAHSVYKFTGNRVTYEAIFDGNILRRMSGTFAIDEYEYMGFVSSHLLFNFETDEIFGSEGEWFELGEFDLWHNYEISGDILVLLPLQGVMTRHIYIRGTGPDDVYSGSIPAASPYNPFNPGEKTKFEGFWYSDSQTSDPPSSTVHIFTGSNWIYATYSFSTVTERYGYSKMFIGIFTFDEERIDLFGTANVQGNPMPRSTVWRYELDGNTLRMGVDTVATREERRH